MTTTTLLTTEQVAALVRKSVSTVNRWATTGKLQPAYQTAGVRGSRLYAPDDVLALVQEEES